MSEIEKLYENAEINPVVRNNATGKGYYIEHQRIEEYPPFTAKKQIELIKFLIKDYNYYLDVIDTNNFENSLASSLNDLWQDLTPEEKAEIKEILCE